MNILFNILLTLLFTNIVVYCQISDTNKVKIIGEDFSFQTENLDKYLTAIRIDSINGTNNVNEIRTFFLSFNTGVPEMIGLGFGYQYSDEWSFMTKVSLKGPGSLSAGNLSLCIGKYFSSNLFFNSISVQPAIILLSAMQQFGFWGFSLEAGFGNEKIIKSETGFYWSVGAGINTIKGNKPLYYPSLKIGFNWNF